MNAHEAVAGVDLGTTSAKVLIRDLDGRQLALLQARTPWITTAAGGTETTAAALAELVVRLLRSALEQANAVADPLRILGVGIAGFAESGVLVDGSGLPVSPVIAWFDRRGDEQVAGISRLRPDFACTFAHHTGLPWDSQASVAKLAWFIDQGLRMTPGHRWLSIPEYLVRVLGGQRVSEASLASRTGLVDQSSGRIWSDGVAEIGLPATLLPDQLWSGRSAGSLRCAALPAGYQGAVLTVAGHDHPVAAIGAGVTGPDELFNSTGTADVIARSLPGRLTGVQRETLVGNGISAGMHVIPGASLLLGGVRGGLVLRRILDLLAVADQRARDRLDAAAMAVGTLPPGLLVSGAGPTGDDVVLRLRDDATPAAVWAAATRYTAAETRNLLDALHLVVPPHQRAVASGGWTRMASVRRAKSSAIDHLEFSDVAEPGVAGAALLALQAASAIDSLPHTSASPV